VASRWRGERGGRNDLDLDDGSLHSLQVTEGRSTRNRKKFLKTAFSQHTCHSHCYHYPRHVQNTCLVGRAFPTRIPTRIS
jgi:hypothetical protein